MASKRFKQKRIGDMQQYSSVSDMLKEIFSFKKLIKFFVVVGCIVLVVLLGKHLMIQAQVMMWHFTKDTVVTISEKLGEEMERDDMWNVNIMLIGHGGADHAGGFLADSIIVASWNPELGSVSMLSIPRDLYINSKEHRIQWKINSVFASAYYKTNLQTMAWTGVDVKSLSEEEQHLLRLQYASQVMSEKLQEVSGIEIKYYAIVDFKEFETVIDHLWGVDIDVPQRLYDTAYPQGKSYTTFTVPKGINHMDGATALKYARSRHSTSDFDRSRRQQQIIEAVMDKLMQKENFTSVSKLKTLYEDYTNMIFTNLSSQEIIGMFQYADKLDHMFSFVLSTNCSYKNYQLTDPGCFLYVPLRENFGGSSVLLPSGSTPSNVSFYDYINNFAFFVMHNQKYLIENPRITVQNGIDKQYARSLWKAPSGHALQMAVKLKKYAFDVIEIDNAEEPHEFSSVYVAGSGSDYARTLDLIRTFMTVDRVYEGQPIGTGTDMILVIGNDYLDRQTGAFNYNK